MKSISTPSMAVLLAMGVAAGSAHAGFVVVDSLDKSVSAKGEPLKPAEDLQLFSGEEKKIVPAAQGEAQDVRPAGPLQLVGVSYVGEPPLKIEVIEGFGKDVPLSMAIKMIAPEGWHGFLKSELIGKFERDRKVSWRGGRRWVEILDILAVDNKLAVEVDWAKKALYVGELKEQPPMAIPLPPPIWKAKTGATLKATVEDWAKAANWTVVWDTKVDYPIVAELAVENDFVSALGELFAQYERAQVPLLIDLHSLNKIIVVSTGE